MYSKKHNELLARVNFPLYTVQCLTERHILVAGGGGGAKTGIRNVIIVTVSRDGHGKVWSNKSTLVTELNYDLPAKSDGKYIFRSCRFGVAEHKNDLVLFTTLNPAVRKKTPLKSFLCKWDMKRFSLQKAISVGYDMLSAMTIRPLEMDLEVDEEMDLGIDEEVDEEEDPRASSVFPFDFEGFSGYVGLLIECGSRNSELLDLWLQTCMDEEFLPFFKSANPPKNSTE